MCMSCHDLPDSLYLNKFTGLNFPSLINLNFQVIVSESSNLVTYTKLVWHLLRVSVKELGSVFITPYTRMGCKVCNLTLFKTLICYLNN